MARPVGEKSYSPLRHLGNLHAAVFYEKTGRAVFKVHAFAALTPAVGAHTSTTAMVVASERTIEPTGDHATLLYAVVNELIQMGGGEGREGSGARLGGAGRASTDNRRNWTTLKCSVLCHRLIYFPRGIMMFSLSTKFNFCDWDPRCLVGAGGAAADSGGELGDGEELSSSAGSSPHKFDDSVSLCLPGQPAAAKRRREGCSAAIRHRNYKLAANSQRA